MNQIELLLRLSENAVEAGDVIAARHHEERAAHGKELANLHRMIEIARQNVEAEMQRWGYRGPKTLEPGQLADPKNPNPIPAPGFLTTRGGADAPRTRIVQGDDKPEHSRTSASRV